MILLYNRAYTATFGEGLSLPVVAGELERWLNENRRDLATKCTYCCQHYSGIRVKDETDQTTAVFAVTLGKTWPSVARSVNARRRFTSLPAWVGLLFGLAATRLPRKLMPLGFVPLAFGIAVWRGRVKTLESYERWLKGEIRKCYFSMPLNQQSSLSRFSSWPVDRKSTANFTSTSSLNPLH